MHSLSRVMIHTGSVARATKPVVKDAEIACALQEREGMQRLRAGAPEFLSHQWL